MPCNPDELRHVPLFELLDDDEAQVLAAQVEIRRFAPRQRIFKAGDPASHGYVVMSGRARVTTTDEDQQEVVVDEPMHGDFFGFASMLAQTEHQTTAIAMEETVCLEVGRDDIAELVMHMPMAGMDMLTVQARQFHASQNLVRSRASRNPNEVIEEKSTFGERLADSVARFGGSWSFIILFGIVLAVYSAINVALQKPRVGSVSVYSAESVPVDAGRDSGSGDHDEPEPAGCEGSLRSELDFEVNRRAETEIQSLSHRLILLMDKMEDVEDVLRRTVSPKASTDLHNDANEATP